MIVFLLVFFSSKFTSASFLSKKTDTDLIPVALSKLAWINFSQDLQWMSGMDKSNLVMFVLVSD